MKKKQKGPSRTFRVIKWLVWLFYPKIKVEGTENLPPEPALIVGNHCQMNGPIACELYTPGDHAIWCAHQMMEWREVHGYAFQDFWSQKPAAVRWFYKLLSYAITPLSVCVFNNANTIPVYRDMRLTATFKGTIAALDRGANVVIFPEHDEPGNHIVNGFQDKFIDVARLYHKRTGKEVCFVPLYIAPRLKKMVLGEPVRFRADVPIEEERQRISQLMMERVTALAMAQPRHRVVTYRKTAGVPYPFNRTDKEESHEKTCC